jgi:hypothetical protein
MTKFIFLSDQRVPRAHGCRSRRQPLRLEATVPPRGGDLRILNAADHRAPAERTLAGLRQNRLGAFGTWDASIRQAEWLPVRKLAFLLAVEATTTNEVPHGEGVGACSGPQANDCAEDDKCVH